MRCHKEYLEKENSVVACVMEHELEDPEYWGYGCRYRCAGCEDYFCSEETGDEPDMEPAKCFSGPHTTYEDEVEIHVKDCEDNECDVSEDEDDDEDDDDSSDEDAECW